MIADKQIKFEEISNLLDKVTKLEANLRTDNNKKIVKFKNNDIFEGQFKDGLKNGRGIYYWASSGDVYEGDWLNGKRTGRGLYYYAKSGDR